MATCPRCATFYVTATNCPKDGASLLDDESARLQGITPIAAERYLLQSTLGEGGMGTVYLAEHRELGRNVAVKILRKEGQNSQSLERFKREAQASSLINNRHVVSILDFGELPDQSLFIVMEHLEGLSLADAIDNEGPFSFERTLAIAVQIAKGLAAAHEKKVIHRDLKPDNIFLLENQDIPDFVKVLDFGIAKMLDGNRLTKTGMVLGTPDYMSPEQATGQPADHRADVYALGILIYEMLVGQRPFMGESFIQVLSQHLHAKPPFVADHRSDIEIPAGLDPLIQCCLAKQPEQRYQSMESLLQALYQLPGALSLLPEQLLPPNVGRRKSPPGMGLPSGGYPSPKNSGAIPSLTARTNTPVQPGTSRAVPGLGANRSAQTSAQTKSVKAQDRVQTMVTEPAPTPSRQPSMMEDQPTNAWTDMATGIAQMPETLPPEMTKAAAKAAGVYDTWHETAEPGLSPLTDDDLDKTQVPLAAEATRQAPRHSPAYGNKSPQTKDPSKKVVIYTNQSSGKVVSPASASPLLTRPNISTLVDGELNKNDLAADIATSLAANPTMAPTSVVVNPLLFKDDKDDDSTSLPPQTPQLFNRKGEIREAPISVDYKSEEVMKGEPTRIAPIASRAPQPAPTAPTGIETSASFESPEEDSPSLPDDNTTGAHTNITMEKTSQRPYPQSGGVVDLEGTDESSGAGDFDVTRRPGRAERPPSVERPVQAERPQQPLPVRAERPQSAERPPQAERPQRPEPVRPVRVKQDFVEDPLEVQTTLRPDQDKSTMERHKEKLEQIARIALTARPLSAPEPPPKPKRTALFATLALLALSVAASGVYWFVIRVS